MGQMSLRWSLKLGVVGAVIGVFSLVLDLALFPLSGRTMDASQIIVMLLVRAIVRLVLIAVVVGIAYYAGARIERAHLASGPDAARQRRLDAVLAGGFVLLLDWVAQVLFLYVSGMSGQPFLALVGSQLLLGVVCVLAGAGVAGIGARDEAARGALAHLIGVPRPTPALSTSGPLPPVDDGTTTPVE